MKKEGSMNETKVTKDLENKTLTIERSFDAPKDRLWQYYADQEKFEQWWGPEGWVTTTKEFNFVPGGRVHYSMKCVDENQGEWFGQESWGIMVIEAVDAPNSFTYKDYFSDAEGTLNNEMPTLTVVNEFHEEDGRAKLVSRSVADSAEQIEELIKMGMVEGFNSQLDKLDKIFAEEA
jgi:uncharacterized protein YndB with AHSA1/START domain